MIKLILRFVFFFSIVFCTQSEIVGQTNNFQCTPFHIGVLSPAPPCTSSGGYNYGNPITLSGNTINATSDSLSGLITTCYSSSSPPLHDLWYEFTASETH